MASVTLSPSGVELEYEGRFSRPRFALLADPIPVYEGLLEHFAQDGASLSSLKIEAGALSSANITCSLPGGSSVRVKIDRLEVTYNKWGESNIRSLEPIVGKAWAALRQADPAVVLMDHALTLQLYGRLRGLPTAELIGRLVSGLSIFGEGTRAGVTLYPPEDAATGRRFASLKIEGFTPIADWVNLTIIGRYSAATVPIEHVIERFDAFLGNCLERLEIELTQENS